jgi:hypothetical protein
MQPEVQRPEPPRMKYPETAMPTVAGILTLISGGLRLLGIPVLILIGFFIEASPRADIRFQHPWIIISIAAILLVIGGVLAVIGGIYTLRRKYWGWALTGAIFAFLPFNLLGLASIILVALSKREFGS